MATQTWNSSTYAANGRFVSDLASSLFEILQASPGERILDLGCGDGELTAKIAQAGAQVTGVDSSSSMVDAALARGLDAQLISGEQLPFHEEFDAVFSNAALHWMQNQMAALEGVYRALKPGGRFVAEMGGHGNIAAIRVALRASLEKNGVSETGRPSNLFFTTETYGAMLRSAGFEVMRIETFARPTILPSSGMRGWLETFRKGVLDRLNASVRESVLTDAVALLRPVLCDIDGTWTADYVRLRWQALKA